MPFAQLLGHGARRHKDGEVRAVCSAHNPETVCSGCGPGGLGPSGLQPVWSLGQDTSRSPSSEETLGPVWSGDNSRPSWLWLGKLRLKEGEGGWAGCSLALREGSSVSWALRTHCRPGYE